jgi:hypothetical protein
MDWEPDKALADFFDVARIAGVDLPRGSITVEPFLAPHRPPTRLPLGKMAVYVFSRGPEVLKIGKVGSKSQARYTSQHYSPSSANSTLAASLLADRGRLALDAAAIADIGRWMRENLDRVNFLMDERAGVPVLTLLEAFLQCRLKPKYEGFKSQRL